MKNVQLREAEVRLEAAREAIDGKMNCHTPEYEALDNLWRAVEALAQILSIANPSDGTRGER